MERKGISDKELRELMGEGKIQPMPDYKSLRDEIAIAVLAAWCVNQIGPGRDPLICQDNAAEAYKIADATLKAREAE